MKANKNYFFMYANFLLYSFALVLAKFGGKYPLFSKTALIFYFSAIFLLAVYAVLWQNVLKKFPLNIAYPNKAVTIVLGIVWGSLFFGEVVRWNMILGAVVIFSGIVIMVKKEV